jgi:predicted O-methyltransferase YrrM
MLNSDSDAIHSNQEVKNYLDRRFGQETTLLHTIRMQSHDDQLPEIQIPIHVGKMLYLLAKIQCAHQILEIGTLGGYSTAWLAQALLPKGRLVSLEIDPYRAQKAREHLQPYQDQDKHIEIRTGHAVELLAQLDAAQEGAFDVIFIDADKENNALYLDWSLRLSRPGTLIVIDNLIPKGRKIGYPAHEEAKAIYAFNDYLAQHPLLEVAAFPSLVGAQGRVDALVIAYVKDCL